ncbi:hypothetical protein [Bacillus paramycoides]|uniref:Uncharacterized protein n=1 Tax=Bacillus paramycoides TaxID=2026194 RepID=A0A1J9UBP4_9BACI|nr:hypothetical protein [Bacillus paramycoides]OJD76064.1 hypothetical protein BAU28_16370 [Bacillus paramycoides]
MDKRLQEVIENITNIADHAICMTKTDYDWLIEQAGKKEEKIVDNFQIEDIDGFYTGAIYVIYADGSGITIAPEEAQRLIDSKEWTVFQM